MSEISAIALFDRPGKASSDLRLVQRALDQQWAIPQPMFRLLPKLLSEIVTKAHDGHYVYSTKERLLAARLLMELHECNLTPVKTNPEPSTDVSPRSEQSQQLRAVLLARVDLFLQRGGASGTGEIAGTGNVLDAATPES